MSGEKLVDSYDSAFFFPFWGDCDFDVIVVLTAGCNVFQFFVVGFPLLECRPDFLTAHLLVIFSFSRVVCLRECPFSRYLYLFSAALSNDS